MPNSRPQKHRQELRQEIDGLQRALAQDPALSAHASVIERIVRQNDNMAMFVSMLVRRLRKHASDDDLARGAMSYLAREGLLGSPLRAVDIQMLEDEAQASRQEHHAGSITQQLTGEPS